MNFPKSIFGFAVLACLFVTTSCEKDPPPVDPPTEPEVTTISETHELELGTTTIFESEVGIQGIAHIENAGSSPVTITFAVIADEDGTIRETERTLDPGCAFAEELPLLVRIDATLAITFPNPVFEGVIIGLTYAPVDPGDNGFNASGWISAGEICIDGTIESAPDQDIDCLWDPEILWQSVGERDIELEIILTGNHDLTVELEGPIGIYQSYNVSAPPALPQFQSLVGEWEEIVAVHIHCNKSPVNDCDSCDFNYSLCYQ